MSAEPSGPDYVDTPHHHHNREELGRLFCEATIGSSKIYLCGKPARLYPHDHPEVALCLDHKYLAPKERADDDRTDRGRRD